MGIGVYRFSIDIQALRAIVYWEQFVKKIKPFVFTK